jgi:hypothetical protein
LLPENELGIFPRASSWTCEQFIDEHRRNQHNPQALKLGLNRTINHTGSLVSAFEILHIVGLPVLSQGALIAEREAHDEDRK